MGRGTPPGRKEIWVYLLLVGVFVTAIWATLAAGSRLGSPAAPERPMAPAGGTIQPAEGLQRSWDQPLPILILQMLVILVAARISGAVAARSGQPAVMGEIVAGILLGPSFLGLLFPRVSDALFPAASLPNLQLLSQIGLMLFLFIVGMELDTATVRARAAAALVISHASILLPFLLGALLSLWLYPRFAPPGVSFVPFGLFMGIAMSITAFPVLARIIQERGLSGSRVGTLALTCAAADDVTAWCLLAAVVAFVKGGTPASTLLTIGLLVLHVGVMARVVGPLLRRLAVPGGPEAKLDPLRMAAIFSTLLLSALVTELIGIHALFGAFLAGAVMPDGGGVKERVAEKIQDLSLVVLLPLFFVFTGLRTQVGLLAGSGLWLVAGVVILVAIVGKVGGSTLAARVVGESWRDSAALGILMNTRGLMELVVLNIGYDMGILSPEVFSMMVLMALATTFMAGPCLRLIGLEGNTAIQQL
jgi:Kef-type K+ transport system membrane component KefB